MLLRASRGVIPISDEIFGSPPWTIRWRIEEPDVERGIGGAKFCYWRRVSKGHEGLDDAGGTGESIGYVGWYTAVVLEDGGYLRKSI